MTPVARDSYRTSLERMRAELLGREPQKIEPARKEPTSVGVADEDEQALTEMVQVLASERNKQQAQSLALIDRALRKLAHSPEDFGLCEECEEEIPAKRLELMPYATHCLECQGTRDPTRGGTRRKLTDFR